MVSLFHSVAIAKTINIMYTKTKSKSSVIRCCSSGNCLPINRPPVPGDFNLHDYPWEHFKARVYVRIQVLLKTNSIRKHLFFPGVFLTNKWWHSLCVFIETKNFLVRVMSILVLCIKYWSFCVRRFAGNLKIIMSILVLNMIGYISPKRVCEAYFC